MSGLMRCIRVTKFGGPEVLELISNAPIPKPVGKQVLIKVFAAGVNPVDTYIRNGTYSRKPDLPYTPGNDGSGVVETIGENVTKAHVGQRVWFSKTLNGSYSEYSLSLEDWLLPLPPSLTFEQGAMMTPYLTAHRALIKKAAVKPNETVLVHGATGGVGTAAIQLCKLLGVDVIGTAGSSAGETLLREDLGISRIYNHRSEGYVEEIKEKEKNIGVILEMLANVNLENDLHMIGQNGRVVVIGCRGSITINPRLTMLKESSVIGCALGKSSEEEWEEQMVFIGQNLDSGFLKPVLWKMYELEKARDAHVEIIENSGTMGQMVLKIR